jgi:hypothetical protein
MSLLYIFKGRRSSPLDRPIDVITESEESRELTYEGFVVELLSSSVSTPGLVPLLHMIAIQCSCQHE